MSPCDAAFHLHAGRVVVPMPGWPLFEFG